MGTSVLPQSSREEMLSTNNCFEQLTAVVSVEAESDNQHFSFNTDLHLSFHPFLCHEIRREKMSGHLSNCTF